MGGSRQQISSPFRLVAYSPSLLKLMLFGPLPDEEETRCAALSCLQRGLGKVEKLRFFRIDGPVNT
jgi:hypothetical protein